MARKPKHSRAYVAKVANKKARTSASKEYFQVFVEGGKAYLFTAADLDKAEKRAKKNPEDVYPVEFTEPEPKVITKVVERFVEVPAKGWFTKLFGR